jgi:glyoxylase-like metal-dependent hydrolase (beta-lactamase superfamily II)
MSEAARHTIDCEPTQPGYVAAYLRVDGEACAFIETYTTHAVPHLLAALEQSGKRPEDVRFIAVTHVHLDHAGGASALLARCPNATLLCHPRAERHLVDPAKLVAAATSIYGEAHFAKVYGTIAPAPADRVRALADGETFELGGSTLRVHHTAGHAKHHFVVHDPATQTVYTGDTFGLVYPQLQRALPFAFISTSPADFDPDEARKSVRRVLELGEPTVCPTHFGEVKKPAVIAEQLFAWIDRSEAWLDEATASGAPTEELSKAIVAKLRTAIAEEANAHGIFLGKADWRLLELDIQLNADGIAAVADKRRRATSGA